MEGGKTLTIAPGVKDDASALIVVSYDSIRATHYDGHFGINLVLDDIVIELLGSDMRRLYDDLLHRRVEFIGENWTDAYGIPEDAASVMSILIQTEHYLLENAAAVIPAGSVMN